MTKLNEKTKETLWDVSIIAVGLLLSLVVLLLICILAFGGPVALVMMMMAMTGPH